MGLFWDLMQQCQLSEQRDHASTLEDRVTNLEAALDDTRQLLRRLLERLETQSGEDIDRDGKVG